MTSAITGNALRDRLLTQLSADRPQKSDAWIQVLSSANNKNLLGLIAQGDLRSITELAEKAGRAQPNVSRSITALVEAGLIAITSEGRRSVPALTAFGIEKAETLGLSGTQSLEEAQNSEAAEGTIFAVRAEVTTDLLEDDCIPGDLLMSLKLQGEADPRFVRFSTDLNELAISLLASWWRVLYRRDAPYRFADFRMSSKATTPFLSCAFKSTGKRIDIIARNISEDSVSLLPEKQFYGIDVFEKRLLEEFIRPTVQLLRSRHRYDRPLQSCLYRLEDSRSQNAESQFCRTAGALGLSPYDLPASVLKEVRSLIDWMPGEESRLEFSSAVLEEELVEGTQWVRSEITSKGAGNRLSGLPELRKMCSQLINDPGPRPWAKGRECARAAREAIGIGTDVSLGGVRGIGQLVSSNPNLSLGAHAPGSLRAFQAWCGDAPTVVLEDEGPTGSAFILARAVGDYLVFGDKSACVADLYTDRQAVGRAFAAEFIAPAEGVVSMVEEGYPLRKVAAHYGSSVETAHRQYENNRSLVH